MRKELWIGYLCFTILSGALFFNKSFGLSILCSCLAIKLQWDIYSLNKANGNNE